MRRSEIWTALSIGLVIGLVMVAFIVLTEARGNFARKDGALVPTSQIAQITPSPTPIRQTTPAALPTPTAGIHLQPAAAPGEDREDVLLLYSEGRPSSFSINFCMLAEYYGLGCKKIDIRQQRTIKNNLLLDSAGQPYALIGVDATLLDWRGPLLSVEDIQILNFFVEQNGVDLLIGKVDDLVLDGYLGLFTEGNVLTVEQPEDTTKDWIVADSNPEITRELTGQIIITAQAADPDTFALVMNDSEEVTSLFSSTDNVSQLYALFVAWHSVDNPESGMVFLDAGETGRSLDNIPLREVYYSAASFSQILPTMMVLRYSLGNETWHRDVNYANLSIDEGILEEPYQDLNYTALRELMRQHDFHSTIALIPENWQDSDPDVIALFLTNPKYFSLVQFGNTGDGYEFYRYATPAPDAIGAGLLPARPLEDQERAIFEGMARMQLHESYTRIPYDRIMVFPGGISPVETLEMLKANNYLATVNAQDLPLDATYPAEWDYGMYPAVNNFASFPNMIRRAPSENFAYRPYTLASILDLFVDKPALFYTFPYGRGMFSTGMDAFDPIADQMNALTGGMEWRSLGYIATHLYTEKENDDGSYSVRMYTRVLNYENPSDRTRNCFFSLPETLNVPIDRVTVNGYDFPYLVEAGSLRLNIQIPANTTAEIVIEYHAKNN